MFHHIISLSHTRACNSALYILIVVSSILAAVSMGGAVTFPTLLIDQFRTNETTTPLDSESKSWIGSIYGLAGIPSILMPMISQKIGRKWGYITACIFLSVGWMTAYGATSYAELLISESFNGLSTNSLLLVCFIGMTEMLTPKYRHVSMQAFGIGQAVGMAACGILGRYLHYRTVSIIMLVPIVIAIALGMMWLESPYWFAYKGELDKCEQIFIQLRGLDELSKNELLELLAAYKKNLNDTKLQKGFTVTSLYKKISTRDFYLPNIHTFVLFLITYWGGVDVIYVYFIEIIKKSTNRNDATFYGSIVMYSVVLVGLCLTNLLVRKFKCKTILKYSASAVVLCLLISSLISGLQTLGVLSEGSLLLVYSLIAYTACASSGFHGIVFIMAADLMSVKHRSFGGALYIIINCALYASSLKLSPHLFLYLGLWCTFLIYALNVAICLWFILKYVPETKGRNLQEVQNYYTFGSFAQRNAEESNLFQLQHEK